MTLTRRALGLALLSAGCERAARPMAGRRVVSISPSTTEAVCAVGARDQLVGRSQHCDHPASVRVLPNVGGFAAPNVEAILALAPTLVVGARGPAGPPLAERLEAHGIATYFPPIVTRDDVVGMLTALGKRLDTAAVAHQAVERIAAELTTVATWARKLPPVRAAVVFDRRPIYVAGPGGFPDECLRLAGAKNVVTRGGAYPTLDLEKLLSLDPDVIVDASIMAPGARSTLAETPGWSALRAVKQGRVRALRSSAALRPGPRIAEAVADMARAAHGMEPPRLDRAKKG